MKCPNCGIDLLGGMKRCPKCGYDIAKGAVDQAYLDKNKERIEKEQAEKAAIEEQKRLYEKQQAEILQRKIELANKMPALREQFLCTTGYGFDGYRIKRYLGIRSGESVLGTGFLSDISAAINDAWGTESTTVGNKLAQAKEKALSMLVDRCIYLGANAVIGVDLDIMTYGPNMIVACANGTAVEIEKE